MATKKLYGATFGPYLYDDATAITDPDGDFSSMTWDASVSDGLHLCAGARFLDTNQSNHLTLTWGENDTADRTFQFLVGGGNRSLTLQGNLTVELASILNQDLTTDASPTFGGLAKVGDATNYLSVAADGELTLHGTARVNRHVDLPVAVLTGPAATLPAIDLEGIFVTYDFSKTTEQSLYYTHNIPYRWTLATDVEVHFFWLLDANAADAAKFVRWGVQYKPIMAGEAVAGAGTSFTQDINELDIANYTVGTLIETTFTTKILGSTLAVHDQLGLRFYRGATNDDYNNDARLVMVHLEFLMDKLGQPT